MNDTPRNRAGPRRARVPTRGVRLRGTWLGLGIGWAVLGLLAGWPAHAAARIQVGAPAAGAEAPDLEDARAALRGGTADSAVLAIHASQLVDAGDIDTLRELLRSGERNTVLAILGALRVRFADGLLEAVTDVAAGTTDPEVATRAADNLRTLVQSRPDLLLALVDRLGRPEVPPDVRSLLVDVVGQSRDLRAVPALLDALTGSAAEVADRSLRELSGHHPASPYDPAAYWPDFWQRHAGLPRDVLLERELKSARADHLAQIASKNDEIVQTRIAHMGQDIDRLMASVTDEFVRVRLAAVQRLGSHPNQEQALNAVPLLLRRLGHGAGAPSPDGVAPAGGDGTASAPASGAVPPTEREPAIEVRTAIVAALGVLGRGRADVQSALLDVVRAADGPIATAAVDALSRERDQPQVVPPLLQFIGRSQVSPSTLVTVLLIIAQNRPDDVFAEVAHWMKPSYGADVRAAAVEAVLADAQLGRALASVQSLAAEDEPLAVRFALAKALGKRLRTSSPPPADARPSILALLANLSDDVDPSVRAEAAASLGELRDAGALAILERRSHAETDRKVVEKLLEALGILKLEDGVPIIGRVCGQWLGDGRAQILEAAQRSLTSIADGRDAAGWLALATTLADADSPSLAAWAARETLLRFEGVQAARETVQIARGTLAEALWADGSAQDAHALLVQLHEGPATYPSYTRRLELLAQTSSALGLWEEAAGHYALLLDLQDLDDATRLALRRSYAVALMEADRHEAALREMETLMAVDASDHELDYRRALLLEELAREPEAEDLLLHLLESLPDEDVSLRDRTSRALQRVQASLGTTPTEDAR